MFGAKRLFKNCAKDEFGYRWHASIRVCVEYRISYIKRRRILKADDFATQRMPFSMHAFGKTKYWQITVP